MKIFQRYIRLIIDTIDVTGLDAQFQVKKNLLPQPNTCELKVYNLNATHRAALEALKVATISLEAGYEGGYSSLFLGDLRTSISTREGPDWVTSLGAGDGEKAIRTARVSASIKKGATTIDVVKTIARALGVGEGNLSSAAQTLQASGISDLFSEGTILSGSASREMTHICASAGLTWSIQRGALQILHTKEALDNEALFISQDTGMIGAPTSDGKGVVTVKLLMIPDVFPGRKMVLEGQQTRGNYRIEEVVTTGDTAATDWYHEIKGKPL